MPPGDEEFPFDLDGLARFDLNELNEAPLSPTTLRPQLSEEESTALIDLISSITKKDIIKALPPDLIGKDTYANLLDPDFQAYWHPNPTAGELVPYKPAPARPQEILYKIANNLIRFKLPDGEGGDEKSLTRKLQVALQARLYKNMKTLSEEPIIMVGVDESEKARRISIKELEEKFHETRKITKGWTPEKAGIRMAIALGIFNEEGLKAKYGINDLAGIQYLSEEKLQTELSLIENALRFGDTLLEKVADFTKKQMQVHRSLLSTRVTYPDVNIDFHHSDLMSLLEVLFAKNSSARDRNDIQLKTTFALLALLFEQRRNSVETKVLEKMKTSLTETMPLIKRYNRPELDYNEKDGFSMPGWNAEEEARIYKGTAYLATSSQFKSLDSSVIKALYPDEAGLTPNNLTDEARMRIVALEVTSADLIETPEKQAPLKELLQDMWRNMGMKGEIRIEENSLGSNVEKNIIRSLKKGQAVIMNKLDHPRYPRLTLYGRDANGVMVEIQLLPVDTYAFDQVPNGPFHHDNLDQSKLADLSELAIPASLNEEARIALNEAKRKRERQISNGAVSREFFLKKNSHLLKATPSHSPSPAQQAPQA